MKKYYILTYYDNKEWDNLSTFLKEQKSDSKILTDNLVVNDLLNNQGFDISTFDELIPERGETVQEVYKNSKMWLEEYRNDFKSITYNDIKIFDVIDFKIFLQLHYLARIKKSIDEEEKPIIFIFKRFFPIFYAIKELIKSNQLEIGLIKKNKIEFFKNRENEKRKLTIVKISNFLNSSEYKSDIVKNTKMISNYAISLGIEKIKRKSSNDYKKNSEKIFKRIKKQIQETSNEINTFFFISGSREDLYIKPLKGIFERFLKENQKFFVVTNNLSTSIILSKNNIPHLNLDKDMKILSNQLKISEEGKTILENIDIILKNHQQLVGFTEIKNFLTEMIIEAHISLRFCEFLFSNFKPKNVYAGLDGEILENSALVLAKKNNVSGFSMLPSSTNPNPIIKEWFHAEKIFVAGTIDYNLLKNMGYDENQLIITGHPKYDFLKKISTHSAKNKLKKIFKYNLQKKIVLIAMSQWNKKDEIWMSDFIQFCNKNNYEIIIKIHPMYITSNNELSQNKINMIKKKCSKNNFLITYDFDIYNLIVASDLIITDFSNVGIEAILLKKSLLTVDFNENPWNYLQLNETGAAINIKNIQELKEISKNILEGKKIFKEKLDNIIDNYNFKNDGNASERIFKELKSNN
jgi:UDP-N-acetylglucosamine 2-epimerase